MNPSRTYLMRVLKRLEARLGAEGFSAEAASVGGVVGRLGDQGNVQEELERLFRVEGMEQLAMGVMWLSAQEIAPLNGMVEDVVEHQVDTLRRILLADPDDDHEENQAAGNGLHGPGSLSRALVDFSRLIADVKRRLMGGGSYQGFSEETAWRVVDQLSDLREAALTKGNEEVPRFCDALGDFLEYVLKNRIFSDIRVLDVIEYANRTLQTVVAGEIPEERGSLEQTIELLRHPSTFFSK
jgi:hypothetical protein